MKPYRRLTQPLVRDARGGELRPTTWDEALDRLTFANERRVVAAARRLAEEAPPEGSEGAGN